MKKTIRWTYNILRTIAIIVVAVPVILFSGAYLALSLPWVQNKIKARVEKEASDFLQTKVTIDEVSISPFNEVLLQGVHIPDQQGDSLIVIDKLGAGIDLSNLIFRKQITFTYGEIIGLHGRITRPDKESPTNLQFIIDAFKPKDDKPPKPFDVEVFNVVIRKSDLRYDVLNEPHRTAFDPNHVDLYNLNADVSLPRLKNNDFIVDVKRLTFNERSGLELRDFSTYVTINDTETRVCDLKVQLPNSVIKPDDIVLHYNSLKTIGEDLKGQDFSLRIAESYVTPSDLSAFEPRLAELDTPIDISLEVSGNQTHVDFPVLMLRTRDEAVVVDLSGSAKNLDHPRDLQLDLSRMMLHANAPRALDIVSRFANVSPDVKRIVGNCGDVSVDGQFNGGLNNFQFDGDIFTDMGNVNVNSRFVNLRSDSKQINGTVKTSNFEIGRLLDKTDLIGAVALNATVDGVIHAKKFDGKFDGTVDYIDFKNYRYNNITANVEAHGDKYSGKVAMNDDNGRFDLEGTALIAGAASKFDFNVKADGVNLSRLLPGVRLPIASVQNLIMDASLTGNNFNNADGFVNIDEISVTDHNNKQYWLNYLTLDVDNRSMPQQMSLSTSFMNANIEGRYDLATVATSVQNMLAQVFPSMFTEKPLANHGNDFAFVAEIEPSDELERLVKLPVKPVYRTTITGAINDSENSFNAHISSPYLLQGEKNIIEQTGIYVWRDNGDSPIMLNATTTLPSKKGKIHINIGGSGENDILSTSLGWKLERESDYHGEIAMKTRMYRDDGKFNAQLEIEPTDIVVNDTIWKVAGGTVKYSGRHIGVNNLHAYCDKQFIKIDGDVSDDPDDVLRLNLNDISLDYVFQTLNINNVDFGGRATGEFLLSNLFTSTPSMYTPKLHVDGLRYNGAVMGDADIESRWRNEAKAVYLNCDLSQRNGSKTRIYGDIFAADDSLYLTFEANHANVEFMKPFMKAFAGDVEGEVSGKAILFGDFKTIDLEGDVHIDSLAMKLDYTNVYYSCKDEDIHIVPGYIDIRNITIFDRDHNTAKLNGWLKHDSFHDPVFNFTLSDAKDLLTYDIGPSSDTNWYGTIYGKGQAVVNGRPGLVKIDVNMETAKRSKFTFVMNDTEEASEYDFITFRDRDTKDEEPVVDILKPVDVDTVPAIVRELTQRIERQNESQPSQYSIDLQVDITPESQLILVMDPVGGDQIKANGTGNLRLYFNSEKNRFEMFGKYTLERGSYNFTLQDIFMKDFTIKDGSTISFNGDPYNAQLNIEAIYRTDANLRDLDESFATDGDLKRTTVPVHALLKVSGDVTKPEIDFDMDFPTLTSESKRKALSVVNTEDMMSRQIIYLLVLNKFYTPDYMTNNSRNNELTSVASSTISSQLRNVLGKLSDNWSITPNVRSDRGDFSDVEVDVALSSQLLDNRLLLNGNFGYRDNTYNTRNSNFIGDFDLEYLLNRRGTIRLKAYNRFNDQNLYVRNAMTTQGVGIVFKHDFDHNNPIFKRKVVPPPDSVATDSIQP